MEMNKMFGNFEFGPVRGISLSHLGIAVRNASGNMVSYDKSKGDIVDVDLIDFKMENSVWAVPCAVKDIEVGNTIKHVNGNYVFVTSVENGIQVIDVAAGEKKSVLPTKSMFGFDFVTKIVSLVDFTASTASPDMPFGNLLPWMMMSQNGGMKGSNLPFMMMLMAQNGNGIDMNNPLMWMAMSGGSESNDFFQTYLMMNAMGLNPFTPALPPTTTAIIPTK